MFKVIYHGEVYTVVNVKIDGFEYYDDIRLPGKTWFLIYDNCFWWVKSDECELYEG